MTILRVKLPVLLVLFFLPWINLRCDTIGGHGFSEGSSIALQTGFQISTGSYTNVVFVNPFRLDGPSEQPSKSLTANVSPSPLTALYGAALVVGLLGVFLCKRPTVRWVVAACSITTASAALALQVGHGFPLEAASHEETLNLPAKTVTTFDRTIIEFNVGQTGLLHVVFILTGLAFAVTCFGIWRYQTLATVAMLIPAAVAVGYAAYLHQIRHNRVFDPNPPIKVLSNAVTNDRDPWIRRAAAARLLEHFQAWSPTNDGFYQGTIRPEDHAESLRLWRTLQDDPVPALRIFAFSLLSTYGFFNRFNADIDYGNVDFAVRAMNDSDARVVSEAISLLTDERDINLSTPLLRSIGERISPTLLDHPNNRVRVMAATGLLHGTPRTPLSEQQVRHAAREVLQASLGADLKVKPFAPDRPYGSPRAYALECVPWLDHPDAKTRERAAKWLDGLDGKISDADAKRLTPAVVRLLRDDNEITRSYAARAANKLRAAGFKIDEQGVNR